MNTLLILCLAFTVAQAIPTNTVNSGTRYTFKDSKLKSSVDDAVESAQNEVRTLMDQYKNTASDINSTIHGLPNDAFTNAFNSVADKIKSYGKSLKPIMSDSKRTPEDKAHQVLQSLTPLLDGIISDFHGAAHTIGSYVTSANSSVHNSMNKLQSGSKNSLINSIDSVQQVSNGLSPEVSAILDSLQRDLNSEQVQWGSNLDNVQEDVENYVPQSADMSQMMVNFNGA